MAGGLSDFVKRKIVASFITEAQEIQILQQTDVREAAQQAGYEIEVLSADGNSLQQIQQLDSPVQQPTDPSP
jgi:ABC-type xylose transport system substrate-binding protein